MWFVALHPIEEPNSQCSLMLTLAMRGRRRAKLRCLFKTGLWFTSTYDEDIYGVISDGTVNNGLIDDLWRFMKTNKGIAARGTVNTLRVTDIFISLPQSCKHRQYGEYRRLTCCNKNRKGEYQKSVWRFYNGLRNLISQHAHWNRLCLWKKSNPEKPLFCHGILHAHLKPSWLETVQPSRPGWTGYKISTLKSNQRHGEMYLLVTFKD